MSGPVPMALGPFKFKAHGLGFTEMERKLDATWAELESRVVPGGRPGTEDDTDRG